MKSILCASVTAISLAVAAPAFANWEATTWGMTPQEVAAAMPNSEIAEGKGEAVTYGDTDTYWKTVTEAVDFEGVDVLVEYLFKERTGLQAISIERADGEQCSELAAAFEKRFGEGETVITEQYKMRFTTWDDPEVVEDWTQFQGLSANICSAMIKPFETAASDPVPAPVSELAPEPPATVGDDGKIVIGDWDIREDKSAFDDSISIFAFLESPSVKGSGVGKAELSLMLRCNENTTNALFTTSMFMTGDQAEVMYRIDDLDAVVHKMSISANYTATGFWSGSSAIPFIRSLYAGKKLAVRVSDDTYVEAVFDLAGIRTAADKVAEACNWNVRE